MDPQKMANRVCPMLTPRGLRALSGASPGLQATLLSGVDVGVVRANIEGLAEFAETHGLTLDGMVEIGSAPNPAIGALADDLMSFLAGGGASRGANTRNLIDPTGKPWNNSTYQACIASAFTSAGAPPDQNDTVAYAVYMGILEAAQQDCIKKAQGGATPASGVLALQKKINALLVKNGYCATVGEDGKMGPKTCGAAAWAAGIDGSIVVPTQCSGFTPMAQAGFLKTPPCNTPGGGPPPPKCPEGQHLDASGNCVPDVVNPTTEKSSTNWWLIGAGILAAGVIAVVVTQPSEEEKRRLEKRKAA